MELDVTLTEGLEDECPNIFTVPEEIWIKIILFLEPLDILSVGRTCRFFTKYADNEHIWRFQWVKLSSKVPWFNFPSVQSLSTLGVQFKDACHRLWAVVSLDGGIYPKCIHCKKHSCDQSCLEEWSSKIVLDIGGKWTWVVNANLGLKKHMSMIAVPKLLRCYDCDSFIDRRRTQAHCDCHAHGDSASLTSIRTGDLYCRNRSLASHTGLEYCSQQLEQLHHQQMTDRPLCLFCEEFRTNRLLCEKEMVNTTRTKMAGAGFSSSQPFSSTSPPGYSSDSFGNPFKSFSNGYCKDTASILGAENIDLLSPLIALDHCEAFPVVRAFLNHIFTQFKMLDELQRPNSCLVFTEPPNFPLAVKEHLLRFLFEDTQITRLCLLPKPLAISFLFDVETCIVVDSGATNTSVYVVLEGKVDTDRTRTASVGGWHVSQFLKQALSWKDQKEANSCPTSTSTSSLDASHVKQRCRLSLNISREEHRTPRTETLHVKSLRGGGAGGVGGRVGHGHLRGVGGQLNGPGSTEARLEYTEVNLSSELYLAPEMMYASLDLVGMIVDAAQDLPPQYLKDCFSHILIQGGNTDLQGFVPRLSCDLREALPEHSAIINVCPYPTGNHSWNTAMGANMAKVPNKYDDVLRLHEPGTPFWISREEYILFGCHQLTEVNSVTEM